MTAAAMCTLSLVVTSFAEQVEFMYFSHGVLFGIGCSGIIITGFLVVTKWFTKWQSLAIGIVAGVRCGPPRIWPVFRALSAVGWRWTFRIVAIFTAVVGPVVCVYGPAEVEGNGNNNNNDNNSNNKNNNNKPMNIPRRKMFDCSVWKDCRYLLVASVMCLGLFAKGIPFVHLVRKSFLDLLSIKYW